MPVIDVRRHAQRADTSDEESPLSESGRAMCARIARESGAYALVVASPLVRARMTAELIGGRVDEVIDELLPEMSMTLPTHLFATLDRLDGHRELVAASASAREIAEQQVGIWTRLASRVGDEERVLAVSHGGVVELPAALVAERLGTPLGGRAFGYCDGVRVTFEDGAPVSIETLRA